MTTCRKIFSWGIGDKGTNGAEKDIHEPKNPFDIPEFNKEGEELSFVQMSAGWSHNAALGSDGEMYLWGDKSNFCLGVTPPDKKDAESKQAKLYAKSLYVVKPEKFKKESKKFRLGNKPIVRVACGKKFTTFITCERKDFNLVKQRFDYPTKGHLTVKLKQTISRRM